MSHLQEKLERDIFGGSDSDLSSEEEEDIQQPRRRQHSPKQRPPPTRDEYESSGASSEDDYQDQPQSSLKKKKTDKVRRKRAEGDGEDDEVELRGRGGTSGRKVQRKRRKQQPEIDLSQLPPEQANKIRLDQQIEAILKSKKSSRPKKRKHTEDVLEHYADDEVARLREAMIMAADEDGKAISEGQPGMAKLKLLPEVMEVLRKASLAQSIVDNNLLQGVCRWLEPLPDKSLPALNIQRDFFPILKRMEFIDSAVLKESGLGKVILFYTKCKRVTPDIARIADDLVSTWSRPIIKRSASYRDRIIPVAQDDSTGRSGERLNAILARAKESEKHRVRKNVVSIPQRELGNYTVAPKVTAGVVKSSISVDVDIERRRRNAERLRSLTRKVSMK